MAKIDTEIRPQSVEISFGTLFSVREFGKETKRVDVVVDVGEDDYFIAGQTHKRSGKFAFSIPGTAGNDNFGRKVGKLSVDEVMEAARLGATAQGYELDEHQVEYLKNASRKPARVLILNRS